MRRFFLTLMGLVLLPVSPSVAQDISSPPVIDTVIIERHNVFTQDKADANWGFRVMNSLHATTRERVVRRELLFREGDILSHLRLQESERNLRALRIFRDVRIDTTRVDGRSAAVVIFVHPDNPRFPPKWCLRNHYPYMNPCFVAGEDYTLAAGNRLTLRYGVLIHSGAATPNELDLAWKRFAAKKGS